MKDCTTCGIKGKAIALAAAGAIAASMCAPAFAFAANGVQPTSDAPDKQTYTTIADGSGTWDPATNSGEGGAGQVQLIYDTTGGTWQDPGDDATDPSDNGTHDNGTYLVTIPKLIKYEDMAIGTVNTSDDYTVNVKGAIPSGQTVTLTAETGKALSTEAGDSGITETTTQGKTTWTADDCFGSLNADGSLSGTDATDNISMAGTAKAAGTYTGYVAYTASLG